MARPITTLNRRDGVSRASLVLPVDGLRLASDAEFDSSASLSRWHLLADTFSESGVRMCGYLESFHYRGRIRFFFQLLLQRSRTRTLADDFEFLHESHLEWVRVRFGA